MFEVAPASCCLGSLLAAGHHTLSSGTVSSLFSYFPSASGEYAVIYGKMP